MSGGRVGLGCAQCWPESADAAARARDSLKRERDLVDESHYHVALLRCPACSQIFLSVFTELVDFVDGNDPQYTSNLPLTPAEAEALMKRGDAVTEAELNALGPGRKSLARDFPKVGGVRTFWTTGLRVGPHD